MHLHMSKSLSAFVALELDPLSNSASFASTETGLAPRFRSSLEHPFTRDIAKDITKGTSKNVVYGIILRFYLKKNTSLTSPQLIFLRVPSRDMESLHHPERMLLIFRRLPCTSQVLSFIEFIFLFIQLLKSSSLGQYLIC